LILPGLAASRFGEAVGRRRAKASAAVNFEAVKESLLKRIMTKKSRTRTTKLCPTWDKVL
jgi:hypothetical protein